MAHDVDTGKDLALKIIDIAPNNHEASREAHNLERDVELLGESNATIKEIDPLQRPDEKKKSANCSGGPDDKRPPKSATDLPHTSPNQINIQEKKDNL